MPNGYEYKTNRAPFLRSGDTTRVIMLDVCVALAFPAAFACYCYGLGVLYRLLFSAAVCYLADVLCTVLAGRKAGIGDFSPMVTGFILTMMLPATISYTVLAVGCLFAILVAKQPFGGIGNNIFNPAAAGMAFVTVIWSDKLFWYPMPFGVEGMARNLSYVLKFGGVPSVSMSDILVGNYCAPIGTANLLILIGCFLFLALQRTVSGRITLSYLLTVAVISCLFPRVNCTAWESVVYEMTSGYLFFAAVFMVTDPVTAPKHDLSKILYGVTAGVLTMVFRHMGGYEQTVCFALLLTNALSHSFDRLTLYFMARGLKS